MAASAGRQDICLRCAADQFSCGDDTCGECQWAAAGENSFCDFRLPLVLVYLQGGTGGKERKHRGAQTIYDTQLCPIVVCCNFAGMENNHPGLCLCSTATPVYDRCMAGFCAKSIVCRVADKKQIAQIIDRN